MTEREIWVKGVEILRALLEDDLVLARAMKERDHRALLAAAMIAKRGLAESMAVTDPALYIVLSRAIVLMNVKGYGALNIDKLRALVALR